MAAQVATYFLAFHVARCGHVTQFPPMKCEQSDVCNLYNFFKGNHLPSVFPLITFQPQVGYWLPRFTHAGKVNIVGNGRARS